MTKCGCTKACTGRCKCFRYGLSCSSLCSCPCLNLCVCFFCQLFPVVLCVFRYSIGLWLDFPSLFNCISIYLFGKFLCIISTCHDSVAVSAKDVSVSIGIASPLCTLVNPESYSDGRQPLAGFTKLDRLWARSQTNHSQTRNVSFKDYMVGSSHPAHCSFHACYHQINQYII